MKYIFVVGAPGSKWSSVVKNIYFSPSFDRSDYSLDRTYHHDADGRMQLMHLGAYYDPGMEFGEWFADIDKYSKKKCEAEFDKPFSGDGIRIIKSHVLAHHTEFLKENWPDCYIVLVHRDDDACLGWWVKCGQFDITYPLYHEYYKNLKVMGKHIGRQNKDILASWKEDGIEVATNLELAEMLGIDAPPTGTYQDYNKKNIKVKII